MSDGNILTIDKLMAIKEDFEKNFPRRDARKDTALFANWLHQQYGFNSSAMFTGRCDCRVVGGLHTDNRRNKSMTTIKDVPMLSADEVEIELNTVLYTAEWDSGYEFRRGGKASVQAHRVISVDNSRRFFRTRCANGCEEEHQFSKGCGKTRLFGDIDKARLEVARQINKDLAKCEAKLDAVEATRKHILAELTSVGKLKPDEPKKIEVK